jgi:predicted dehydrogenase
VTNFGVHYIDFIQWALGADAPEMVTALGGRVSGMTDNREIPDTLEAVWQYPGGTLVTFSQFNCDGCAMECAGLRSGAARHEGNALFVWKWLRSCS